MTNMSGTALVWMLVAMVGIPFAIVLIVIAGNRAGRIPDSELREYGRTATGRITDLGIDSGDGMVSPTYWVDVAVGGPRERFHARINIQADQHQGLHPGSLVNVTYLPGEPGSARILRRQ